MRLSFENPLANALRGSFREWASADSKRKLKFRVLTTECLSMIDQSLGELMTYGPGPWWTWYVRNHMRFRLRGDDLRVGSELIQTYLADYAHGRLRGKTAMGKGSVDGDAADETKTPGKAGRDGKEKKAGRERTPPD